MEGNIHNFQYLAIEDVGQRGLSRFLSHIHLNPLVNLRRQYNYFPCDSFCHAESPILQKSPLTMNPTTTLYSFSHAQFSPRGILVAMEMDPFS